MQKLDLKNLEKALFEDNRNCFEWYSKLISLANMKLMPSSSSNISEYMDILLIYHGDFDGFSSFLVWLLILKQRRELKNPGYFFARKKNFSLAFDKWIPVNQLKNLKEVIFLDITPNEDIKKLLEKYNIPFKVYDDESINFSTSSYIIKFLNDPNVVNLTVKIKDVLKNIVDPFCIGTSGFIDAFIKNLKEEKYDHLIKILEEYVEIVEKQEREIYQSVKELSQTNSDYKIIKQKWGKFDVYIFPPIYREVDLLKILSSFITVHSNDKINLGFVKNLKNEFYIVFASDEYKQIEEIYKNCFGFVEDEIEKNHKIKPRCLNSKKIYTISEKLKTHTIDTLRKSLQ
ncbi:MAG: hypothetical protein RMJ18_01795 [Candidatus Aenigmarchaeota archaeon]|nr:hypothetical protein [Candidatus Aenigmarchaeota archaeon]MDW8160130.1 hypothetical protein [Candidatus Aenigmarchaeota archaeon]